MEGCAKCGKPLGTLSIRFCDRCAQEYYGCNKRPKVERKHKKPVETVDDIAKKARSHGLTYGKYLEARNRGEYLDEIPEE